MDEHADYVHPATSISAVSSADEKHSTSAFSELELARKALRAF